jgi:hypothetical protein
MTGSASIYAADQHNILTLGTLSSTYHASRTRESTGVESASAHVVPKLAFFGRLLGKLPICGTFYNLDPLLEATYLDYR